MRDWNTCLSRLIRPAKRQPHHADWIVACWRDTDFSLAVVTVTAMGKVVTGHTVGPLPYAELWQTLRSLPRVRRKVWIIGHGTRPALARAGLMRACEAGLVKLPKSVAEDGEERHAGRLTITQRLVEVDCSVGSRDYKFLDWSNYGVTCEQTGYQAGVPTIEAAISVLSLWLDWCASAGLSSSRTTAAQIGYAKFRSDHVQHNAYSTITQWIKELERRAVLPGRNECFRTGDIPGTTYSLDVRSCHAAICRDEQLPAYCAGAYPCGVALTEVVADGADHWTADVVLDTDSADYPARYHGSVVYPVGRFFTTLCWPEFRRALRAGHVRHIVRAARYVARPLLRDYAEWYLRLRAESDRVGAPAIGGVIKGIFVASLGYMARQRYGWQPWPNDCPWKWWQGITRAPDHSADVVSARVLDGAAEWLKVGGEARDGLPLAFATICSFARVKLLEIFDHAGRENILYCDTDGVLCTERGFSRLASADGMCGSYPGELRERFRPGAARIGGLKVYTIGNEYICAGGVRTRQSLLTGQTVYLPEYGTVDTDGRVHPVRTTCRDQGSDRPEWVNEVVT